MQAGLGAQPQPGSRGFLLTGASEIPSPDIRAALASALFKRPTSLVIGHVAGILLSLEATQRFPGAWPGAYLIVSLGLAGARLACIVRFQRRWDAAPEAARTAVILSALPFYQLVGLLWSLVCGALAFTCVTRAQSAVDSILAMTWALGTAAGLASRNASTPGYAFTQIALWVLPQVVACALFGGWYWASSAMTTLYFLALCSIIRQQYADMRRMIMGERTHAALASRFDAALSNMSQGLILYDAQGRLQVVNAGFYATFALAHGSLAVGCEARDVLRRCAMSGILRGQEGGGVPSSLEALADAAPVRGVLDLADGRSVAVSHQRLADGGLISTYEDITQRRRSEAQIAYVAHHDTLTGLPNRALFGDSINEAVAGVARGERFAVICLDLDHFKAVNDTLGHGMGDRLLCAVTGRIVSCLRDIDLVARLGGDEFAIIIPGGGDAAPVGQIACRIIDSISQSYDIEGSAIVIGASAGIVLAPDDGETAETLLMHADLALYSAKAQGRGTACFFEPELSLRLEARRQMERDLRLALMRQEFELHYQPMVNVQSGRITGFEALLRWNHPGHGLLMPDRFITLAEETGLIVPLGDWVLRRACMDAAGWPRAVSVAVNLSPVQLRNTALLHGLVRALENSGLAAGRLEVEITEAAVLADSAATLGLVQQIRELGVRVAFDDFGTGFSSLSSLHRFPFDKIKIDKSFIRDLDHSPSARAIVRAIAGLGASLQLVTTAEGVETDLQLAQLRLLGCTEVQGYLLGKPRPEACVPEMLRDSGIGEGRTAPVAGLPMLCQPACPQALRSIAV